MKLGIIPLALLGVCMAGCGLLPGAGINTVPWPGTDVSRTVQLGGSAVATTEPVRPRREAALHTKHVLRLRNLRRVELEAASATSAVGLAFAATAPLHEPIIGSDEWRAQRAKQQLVDERKDRELANTINSICKGC